MFSTNNPSNLFGFFRYAPRRVLARVARYMASVEVGTGTETLVQMRNCQGN